MKDAQRVVYPTRMFLRERLLAFDLPEWLPHLDMGMPFLANPSNGVCYPLNALLLLPSPYSIGLFIVAHAMLAILGAWGLLRSLRVRSIPSAVGAVAFALGGYMVSLTWVPNYMMSLAWLPVVSFCALRSLRSASFRDAALTGVVWALQILSGEPQGVVLTAWFLLTLLMAEPTHRVPRLRQWLLLGTAGAIALCVAMPQILPALELFPRSRRSAGIELREASHWSLHPLRLLELFAPNLFGNPIHFDEFLGFFMDDEDSELHRDPWIASPYLGSLVLIFAALGLWAPRRRHRRWVRALAVLLLASLLLAVGRHTPLFGWYFEAVPFAQLFRYPAKFFGLSAAIIPLLGAAGLDGGHDRTSRRRFLVATLLLIAALALGAAGAQRGGQLLHTLRPSIASTAAAQTLLKSLGRESAILIITLLVLFGARRQTVRTRSMILAGVATLQVLWSNFSAYATVPSNVYAEPRLARQIRAATPKGEPTRLMNEIPSLDLPDLDSAPLVVQAHAFTNALFKNLGIAHGIGYAESYISSEEGLKYEFWQAIGPHRRQMLDVFGIRHWVVPNHLAFPAETRLRRLEDTGPIGAAVYQNESALPFAYAVAGLIKVPDTSTAVQTLLEPNVAAGRVAVVEEPAQGLPAANTPTQMGRAGECHLTGAITDRLELDCELSADGFVVVNESYHPNFTAQLDGVKTEIWRANLFVMATAVPKGKHRLKLEYSETALVPGLLVCSLGLFITLLLHVRRHE